MLPAIAFLKKHPVLSVTFLLYLLIWTMPVRVIQNIKSAKLKCTNGIMEMIILIIALSVVYFTIAILKYLDNKEIVYLKLALLITIPVILALIILF